MNHADFGLDDLDDDGLLAALRAAVDAHDAPPADLQDRLRAAFALAQVDVPDDLAELVRDSALEPVPVGVRGDDGTRYLTFQSERLTVEVAISWPSRALVGQLAPSVDGPVEVRTAAESIPVAVDELGRFHLDRLPTGPVSIRCRIGGRPAATDWFVG